MHKLLGDFVEARSHYNVAMRIYAKVVGRDHASYAMTLHNLGSLNKSQIHFDTTLKATERLSLVETALEYLEEALEIRDAELGPEHPYTVATRSAIGSTLAAQVLHQHKMVVSSNEAGTTTSAEAARAAKRASVAATATDNGSTNGSGREILTLPTPSELVTSTADASNEESSSTPASHTQHQQRQYISLNPDDITKAQWKAAEDHLREALQTAIDNPRGKRISGIVGSGGGGSKKKHKKKGGKSKNNQQRDNAGSSGHSGVIETLSAASAGQNLAVFLKSMAMTSNPYDMSKLQEAKDLYEQVQRVRSKLLPMTTTAVTISTGGHGGRQQRQSQSLHPDLYATKFSLAELLEVMGDEETANAIRQEILDTYHPGAGTGTADSELSHHDDDNDCESENVNDMKGTKQVVMVERTKANSNQPER
jgi:tetratricopeptide (TPR) repeat protein